MPRSFFFFLAVCASVVAVLSASAQQVKKPFTVADDIAFTHFANGTYGDYAGDAIQFSPNGEYFCVLTSRGRLDLNQVEESLRFYRTADVEAFLKSSNGLEPPSPVWTVTRSAKKEPITDMRWLADSSGIAFLEDADGAHSRIVLADIRKKIVEPLTPEMEDVKSFDISDRQHYFYVSSNPAAFLKKVQSEEQAPAIVGTGSNIFTLLFPAAAWRIRVESPKTFWEIADGKRFEVKNENIDPDILALSPDGHSMVTVQKVTAPADWQSLYPAPYKGAPFDDLRDGKPVRQYVLLDLRNGTARPLTDAPTSDAAGWLNGGYLPTWSSDGQAVLLPGTFLKSKENAPSRPCVAVVHLASNSRTCVEQLKSRTQAGGEFEEGFKHILSAHFAGGDNNSVEVKFFDANEVDWTIEYRLSANGSSEVAEQRKGEHQFGPHGLEIGVREALNQSPVLAASNKVTSRVIWDPNPQFKNIELGDPRVYTWKDEKGRVWRGGLYMPIGYQAGRSYPLVIQTHGFDESLFLPSGAFPTAFAARELAATGIAVLQVGGSENCAASSTSEASCNVAGLASAAKQLAADGLIDIRKIGYIGFSHSCYYGIEMLTRSSVPLATAVLADGYMADYLQFLIGSGDGRDVFGAPPIGEGLQAWLKNSPGFNLDKVTAPLLIATERDGLDMWQPYAVLHYLKKPVDLVMLNTDEHVITNPVERMASQGLSLDWFRFWLQGYEDPAPAKADQYKRWRGLRELQAESEKKSTMPQAALH